MVDIMLGLSEDLLRKIQAGEATPQDVSNAIKLLQNNDITIVIDRGEPLPILGETLPFQSSHMDEAI